MLARMVCGKVSEINEVSAAAAKVWEIYRGFELGHFINQHLSQVIGTVDIIGGDGGVGSVIRVTFPPGSPVIGHHTERFRVMDDDKRVKEAELVEGGYLALGFTSFRVTFEIIENGADSSIVRTTMEYEIDEKFADNVSLVSPKLLGIVAQAVDKHLVASST